MILLDVHESIRCDNRPQAEQAEQAKAGIAIRNIVEVEKWLEW